MDHFARLGSLIAETGPLLDPIEVTEFPEEKAWGIQLDEETFLFVDYQSDDQSVVFSAELGVPAAVNRLLLYELMLRYNYLWHETGGLRFALDGPGGVAHLILSTSVDSLDLARFSGLIGSFKEAVDNWRKVVSTPGNGAEGSPSLETGRAGSAPLLA